MVLNVRLSASALALCAAIATGPVSAGNDHHGPSHETTHAHGHSPQRHGHGAHVHGSADLNLALDGRHAHIELTSPAVNIVGFEHPPATPADHAAVDRAVAALKRGDRLFQFNDEAGCRMQSAEVVPAWSESDVHDAHAEQAHADFDVVYAFECATPARLERLRVGIFKAFPGTSRLTVQFVVGDRQGGVSLTASEPALEF